MTKTMQKWLGFHFSTGSYTGEDYRSFQRNAKADLKKQIIPAGFELHAFNGNHYEFSAVLKYIATGKFIYVSIPDVRFWQDEWAHDVLIRTMAHDKDWTGGPNNRCEWDEIAETAKRLVERG